MKLRVVPLTLKQANELITKLHRHHKPVAGHRFSLGALLDNELVGCVVVGRPVAREVDQYSTAEVTRLATDGTRNCCSFLYGAASKVCKEMGFDAIRTYTLDSEPGTSLKAAGWRCDGVVRKDGKGWLSREGRRTDQPTTPKVRWRKTLNIK